MEIEKFALVTPAPKEIVPVVEVKSPDEVAVLSAVANCTEAAPLELPVRVTVKVAVPALSLGMSRRMLKKEWRRCPP
jgi:hypothetical protein